MEPFTITTSLSRKEYITWALQSGYRNQLNLVLMSLGVLMTAYTFYINSIISKPEPFPWTVLLITIFLLLLPFINTALVMLGFDKKSLQDITYTFSEEAVSVTCATASSVINWEHFRGIRYSKKILVLYVSNSLAHFIKTEHLTLEQQSFIWHKIAQKK